MLLQQTRQPCKCPICPICPSHPTGAFAFFKPCFSSHEVSSRSIPTPYHLRTKSVPTPRIGVGWGVLYAEIVSAHAVFYGAKVPHAGLLFQHPFPHRLQLYFQSIVLHRSFILVCDDNRLAEGLEGMEGGKGFHLPFQGCLVAHPVTGLNPQTLFGNKEIHLYSFVEIIQPTTIFLV